MGSLGIKEVASFGQASQSSSSEEVASSGQASQARPRYYASSLCVLETKFHSKIFYLIISIQI